MTVQEYLKQYHSPKSSEECAFTGRDWPTVMAWMRDNGIRWKDGNPEKEEVFASEAMCNFLVLSRDADTLRMWYEGGRTREDLGAKFREDLSFAANNGHVFLCPAALRTPVIPPKDLDF